MGGIDAAFSALLVVVDDEVSLWAALVAFSSRLRT